jgi:3',5'-cyclic AMP phosphodiesterase CpdA
MRLRRREFLKYGSLSLAAAGLIPRWLWSSTFSPAASSTSSLLKSQLFNTDTPFPYDGRFFACAERIYNVRPAGGGEAGSKASLNLVLAPGKKLDIKILTAETQAGLSSTNDVSTFYGVEDILDAELSAGDIPRLYYQVLYREGSGSWLALFPKSVKLPTNALESGGEIKVLLIGDDHTFDDGDYTVPPEYKAAKLSGEYVNDILRGIRFNPGEPLRTSAESLRNGFCLAQSLRYIMASEDPDLVINLGDTTGIGAGYKWQGLGLPTVGLTDKDYDYISYVLWLRMRKMYSAITPHVPMYIAQGNHDGEEQWNPLRFRARYWRSRLFAMPDDKTYPEGGHPDGLYYAFSWGSDAAYRGGARFIVLHTTAFTGDAYPKTPEGWTLGEAQRQWFERTVKLGEKHWVFACQHHALGGWPAGSSEQDKSMAYGRGPLFTHHDYLPYADPDLVEQVKLTNLGSENGLRAILYGHDHIYFQKKLAEPSPNKEMLALCCGSTKYMGEAGWWKDPFWSANYGTSTGPAPNFWGPPGITRLTIGKDEASFDFLATALTWYSNHPPDAGIGTLLASRKLVNPPAAITVDSSELSFQAVEGRKSPPPQIIRIRNTGGGCLRYEVKADAPWVRVSDAEGESWGEWAEVKVSPRSKSLAEGSYSAGITVISNDLSRHSKELKVRLTVGPPAPYPPQDFRGSRTSGSSGSAADVLLTWKPNPQNRNVRSYRLYTVGDAGNAALIAELSGRAFSFQFRDAGRAGALRFALAAVDNRMLEGQRAYAVVP